jgi:hypothetical protein
LVNKDLFNVKGTMEKLFHSHYNASIFQCQLSKFSVSVTNLVGEIRKLGKGNLHPL